MAALTPEQATVVREEVTKILNTEVVRMQQALQAVLNEGEQKVAATMSQAEAKVESKIAEMHDVTSQIVHNASDLRERSEKLGIELVNMQGKFQVLEEHLSLTEDEQKEQLKLIDAAFARAQQESVLIDQKFAQMEQLNSQANTAHEQHVAQFAIVIREARAEAKEDLEMAKQQLDSGGRDLRREL